MTRVRQDSLQRYFSILTVTNRSTLNKWYSHLLRSACIARGWPSADPSLEPVSFGGAPQSSLASAAPGLLTARPRVLIRPPPSTQLSAPHRTSWSIARRWADDALLPILPLSDGTWPPGTPRGRVTGAEWAQGSVDPGVRAVGPSVLVKEPPSDQGSEGPRERVGHSE